MPSSSYRLFLVVLLTLVLSVQGEARLHHHSDEAEASSSQVGVATATCRSEWNSVACSGDYECDTCGHRIAQLAIGWGKPWQVAGQRVADEFPNECQACGGCAAQWDNWACAGLWGSSGRCNSCGGRIETLMNESGMSWRAAGEIVADAFVSECGQCGGWPASYDPGSGGVPLRLIPNAEERFAVCNDGSSAGFYYAPPEEGDAKDPPVWILFQQGGSWCWNDGSCRARSRALSSSNAWETKMTFTGILAERRFRSAHRVFLRYCTSDGYLGNRTGPLGWQFRGRSVVKATIEEMVWLGMGSAAGTKMLYSGCSAGGRGVSYNIDWVQTLLPTTVDLRGFMDSPLWIDLAPLVGGRTSLRAQTQAIAALYPEALDQDCVRVNFGRSWRCIMGEFSMAYVKTPSLIFAHQDDTHQLHTSLGHSYGPIWPRDHRWARQLKERTVRALVALPSRHSIFSVACTGHCVARSDAYKHLRVGDQTLQTAVERFLFEDVTTRSIQKCDGHNCCARDNSAIRFQYPGWPLWFIAVVASGAVLLVLFAMIHVAVKVCRCRQLRRSSSSLSSQNTVGELKEDGAGAVQLQQC